MAPAARLFAVGGHGPGGPAAGRREDFATGGERPARAAVLTRFLELTDDRTAVINGTVSGFAVVAARSF